MIRHASISILALLAVIRALASGPAIPDQKSVVAMAPYKVEDTLVRGFTISYGVKYLWWGPVDDASFEDVDAGSLPAKAGIKSGDRILNVNGKAVREMKRKEMEATLFRNGVTVKLQVQSPGAPPRTVELSWPAVSWDPKLSKK